MENGNLMRKEEEALKIIQEVYAKSKIPFVLFTGGKDSLVTLHLVRRVMNPPVSALFLDTTLLFEEIYRFVEKIRRLWGLRLIKERSERTRASPERPGVNREECCRFLRIDLLGESIKKYSIDYLFVGLRGEEGNRADTRGFYSQGENCTWVCPLINFTEKEVWEYIAKYHLPYCSLYDKGYRDLECKPCTVVQKTVDESLQGLNDRESVIQKLKSLGYLQ